MAGTLAAPGATIYHEVRGSGPLLVITGAANDAGAFEALAELRTRRARRAVSGARTES